MDVPIANLCVRCCTTGIFALVRFLSSMSSEVVVQFVETLEQFIAISKAANHDKTVLFESFSPGKLYHCEISRARLKLCIFKALVLEEQPRYYLHLAGVIEVVLSNLK